MTVPLTVRSPPTEKLPVEFMLPVTFNCDPLNVRLPLSCSSPFDPAVTTLPDVRSDTCIDATVATPVTLALVDFKKVTVPTPVTFTSEAPVPPEAALLGVVSHVKLPDPSDFK